MDRTRAVAAVVGVIAGLIAVYHGYNEALQGSASPGSIFINAVGPPCQGGGCFPAITILPSFLLAGVTTIVLALIIIAWAAFVQRKNGGIALIVLSLLLLLVGGGYLAPVLGLAAGVVGTRIVRT